MPGSDLGHARLTAAIDGLTNPTRVRITRGGFHLGAGELDDLPAGVAPHWVPAEPGWAVTRSLWDQLLLATNVPGAGGSSGGPAGSMIPMSADSAQLRMDVERVVGETLTEALARWDEVRWASFDDRAARAYPEFEVCAVPPRPQVPPSGDVPTDLRRLARLLSPRLLCDPVLANWVAANLEEAAAMVPATVRSVRELPTALRIRCPSCDRLMVMTTGPDGEPRSVWAIELVWSPGGDSVAYTRCRACGTRSKPGDLVDTTRS